MKRLQAAIKVDFVNQWRNRLYQIGIGVGLLLAVMLAWLAPIHMMPQIVPALILAALGGSTLMYVGGMIVFERDERTLAATIVSPLRVTEYLWSKILSLGFLATVEALIMVIGSLLIKSAFEEVSIPNLIPVVLGIVLMGMMYTLAGIILVVRYRSITEFLLPMAGFAVVAQLPILYFLDMVTKPVLLLIPTSAPTMLIRGGYLELATWQCVYAVGYSGVTIAILVYVAHREFNIHVVRKAG